MQIQIKYTVSFHYKTEEELQIYSTGQCVYDECSHILLGRIYIGRTSWKFLARTLSKSVHFDAIVLFLTTYPKEVILNMENAL